MQKNDSTELINEQLENYAIKTNDNSSILETLTGVSNAAMHVESLLRMAQGKKAFKDSKNRIGGSKKEKAAYRKVELSSLVELEKNEVNAIELIRKDRVYPKVDVSEERSRGVSSGAAFLKVKMRQLYAPAPSNSKESREIYVRYAEQANSSFKLVKSVEEFIIVRNAMFKELTTFQDRQKYFDSVGKRLLKFMYGGYLYHTAKQYESINCWEWAEKKVVIKVKKAELEINTYPPLSQIIRTGGITITDADITVESIQQKFGFKEVEFGIALKDSESKEHIRHFLGAMADLGNVLNMDLIELNRIGNLSMAFATRGSGKASAHYNCLSKIINLTNKKGCGAVAHEYGHYIDNVLPIMGNGNYEYKLMASETPESVKNENVNKAVRDIFDYIYFRKGAGQKLYNKKKIQASEKRYIIPSHIIGDDIETYFNNFKQKYVQFNILDKLRKRDIDVLGFIVRKFGYDNYEFTFESQKSSFYSHSLMMSSDYWSRPCELFARAFETYIYDKLANAGRCNNYLVSGVYFDRIESVYPAGEERNDLFVLFDNLMRVIKKEYRIKDFRGGHIL